ncbi:unnamed protein product, partial [Symbiodinium natans]
YSLVKLGLLAFWISSALLCCMCCCGCRCFRKKSSTEEPSKKNGNKASKAAEKGKAATAPANATNKSAQSKKK